MSTNPVLVPVSLVSQFLANEKMASRHWLQCKMECLLDQVFDQLSTKFEDYFASNAITDTAHHTTIDTDHIQHQHQREPPVHSHPQFQTNTDHLINTEFPVAVGQSQNTGQMMNVNGQVNPNEIHSEALMFDQPQYPPSLSFPTSNLEQSDQNDQHGADGLNEDENQTRNGDIDDDQIDVKEEIDHSHEELFTIDQPPNQHLLSVQTSNFELSNQNDIGSNQPPIEDDNASRVDSNEIEIKEEIDESNGELMATEENSQLALPVSVSTSNEQSNNYGTSENDEEFDGTRDDAPLNGHEYGHIDDARMDCDEVELEEEIDDTNNQLTNEPQQNPALLPAPTSNVDPSSENDNRNDDNGLDDQQQNEHLRDDNDETNEPNEVPSRPRKKPRLETTQPNNRSSRVTRQSTRLANLNQADQVQHINEQSNSEGRQSNEQAETSEETDETKEINNEYKQIITLSVQCDQNDCSQMFPNKTELNAHMNTQHNILPFRCLVKDCKQSFSSTYILKDHFNQVHPNTTQWNCDKCPKHFSKCRLLSAHNNLYHQLGQYNCSFANCTFKGEYLKKVINHYNYQHMVVELICQHPNCGRRFNNKCNFLKHQQAHLGIKPYRCKWPSCGYAATHGPNTIDHIRRMHLKRATETSQIDPREYLEVIH